MRAHLPFSAAERAWRRRHMDLVVPDHHFTAPKRKLVVVGADEIVHGFDVSSYQPAGPDFSAGGRRFGIFKATEGTTYFDPHFAANRSRAHALDLFFIGLYHFARPSGDPVAQARYFLSKVGARQPGEVGVLDFETSPWSVPWIVAFLNVLHDAGWPTLFYSYLGMLSANPTDGIPQTGTGLWVAAYGTREPGSGRWSHKDLWQHTDGSASVPGNDGPWDCSRGLASILAARAGSPSPGPATPAFTSWEDPVLVPLKRRVDEAGKPESFTEDGHTYAYIYDAPGEVDATPVGKGAKLSVKLIVGPTDPANDGTVVDVWSGDAGQTMKRVNLSAFYNRFPVTGAGRQSVVSDSPLDGWVQTLVVPA